MSSKNRGGRCLRCFLQVSEVSINDDGGWRGGVSVAQPPEAEEMKIGEMSINLSKIPIQGTIGMGQKLAKCMSKASLIPSMVVRYSKLRDQIHFMSNHAQIGKFIGIKPSEKALIWWINSSWKPKGHFDLHLGSKGFSRSHLSI